MSLFPGLTDSQSSALVDVATAIRTEPQWLWELVNFESGHNPQRKNVSSSARGLIQFMDSTAKEMGYKGGSAELISKFPTYEAQMRGPVKDYFMARRPPFNSKQSLFMAVFYPVYRTVNPDTLFPISVQKANPGIDSVQSYMDKASRNAKRINIVKAAKAGGSLGLVLVVAGVFYILRRNL